MIRKLLAFLPFERFRTPPARIAVLPLLGTIAARGRFGQGLNLAGLNETIEAAFAVKHVTAVALAINSPGGSPVQSALIMQRIRALAEEKKIPVHAFAEDVAASGGYLLALAGDDIHAHEASIVGSIGVIFSGFGFTEAIAKIGVERRVYTAGSRKAMLDPFRPENDQDVSLIKDLQAGIHGYFISLVKARRGSRLNGPEEHLFSGEVWTGAKAAELGLTDGVGDLRSVMRAKYGPKTKFRVIGERRGWLRSRLGLQDRGHQLTAGILDDLEARGLWSRFGL